MIYYKDSIDYQTVTWSIFELDQVIEEIHTLDDVNL